MLSTPQAISETQEQLIGARATPRTWSQMFVDIFGRVTSGGRLIPEIDGLRFIAIISVLAYHTTDFLRVKTSGMQFDYKQQNYLAWFFLQGNVGVPLFFMISGFILAVPFIKAASSGGQQVSLKKFYLRRITRLEPPYLINLLLLFTLLCLFKHVNPLELFPNLLASIFYVHNLYYECPSLINVVAWSLEIEAQFYLLAPLFFMYLCRLCHNSRVVLLVSVMLLTALLRSSALLKDNPRIELSLLGKYEYFLAGILLADCYIKYNITVMKKAYHWDVLSLCSWIAIPYLWSKSNLNELLPFVAMIAYWGVFRGVILNKLFCFLPFVLIGGMCYSIYLYHFLFISLIGNSSIHHLVCHNYYAYLPLQVMIIGCGSILGPAILFVIIEKPFMHWKLSN